MFGRLAIGATLLALLVVLLHNSTEAYNVFIDEAAKPDSNARILFLTAHPDDECMFFAPTIMALTSKMNSLPASASHSDEYLSTHAYPEVFSLCLSFGDADGLGVIRREELRRSLDVLGIRYEHRAVVDHPDLKDNITSYWKPDVIAEVLSPYVLEHRITTILTFDHGGISGHPNHISLPEGVMYTLRNYKHASRHPPPKLFSLVTHPITKYSGIAGAIFAKMGLYKARMQSQSNKTPSPVFVSGISDYLTALRAMRQHWSQLVWFRWLYVSFSKYMWVNEWVETKIEVG